MAVAVDALAYNVGALVAEEQAGQHLQLVVRFLRIGAEYFQQAFLDQADVAIEIGKRTLQLEIGDDTLQGIAQAVLVRVVDAVGRCGFGVFDVFGRDGRAHENKVVVEIGAMQHFAAHRIEEGFGQFRLLVVGQHADVVQLHFTPHFIAQIVLCVIVFQHAHAFINPFIVEGNAFTRFILRGFPVAGFEVALGRFAGQPEQAVMLVEPVKNRARRIKGDLRRKDFGEGGVHGQRLYWAFHPASLARSTPMPPHTTINGL